MGVAARIARKMVAKVAPQHIGILWLFRPIQRAGTLGLSMPQSFTGQDANARPLSGTIRLSMEGIMELRYLHDKCPGYKTVDSPLWWHKRGLSQTASGYGSKLTSPRMVELPDGRKRRVYVTIWSNIGTAWITLDGERWILRDCD